MAKHDVVVSQGKRTLKKRMLARWLLLIPVAYILIFAYGPMAGLIIAFKKYKVRLGIFDSPWVGFDNFRKFFSSYKFPIIMKNTIVISLYSLVVTFPIPIIFALLLNCMNGRIYKKMIQTVTYIPYLISSVVMVGLIFQILDNRSGISGLAEMSMLKDDSYPTYAIAKTDIKAKGINLEPQVPLGEIPGCVIHELGYCIPFNQGTTVDPLTIYLLLEHTDDPRIEKALDEMLKEYVW